MEPGQTQPTLIDSDGGKQPGTVILPQTRTVSTAAVQTTSAPIWDYLRFILVVAFGFLLASLPAQNSDVWMNLASGRALVENPSSFGSEPFAYTTGGVYWVSPSWFY